MGASAGLAMFGAGFSAMGQQRAGKYQQQVAEYNASVAELQAQDAISRGLFSEARHREGVRGLIGAQRASMAAQGQDLESGSALEVQLDTSYLGERDAQQIRNNAAREAWGYRAQAEDFRARGSVARAEATSRAIGTVLGTAGNLALTKWGMTTGSRAPKYSGYWDE